MKGSPSLLGRGLVAVALMIGFYVLGLAITLFLLWLPYAEWHYAGRIHAKLAIFCVVTAVIIFTSILPRLDHFPAPGPRLEEKDHPKLFEQLESVARAAQESLPREVYLLPDLNAWVAQRGGVMGFGSRKVMGVGLPLLSVLSVSQLRAVLAHEFGHFAGSDTKLGPWVYKTRVSIGRTIESLAQRRSIVALPFVWYGNAFLRITQAISRRQEIAADRFAAEKVGTVPLMEGLRTIHRTAHAYHPFVESEYSPVVEAGFRVPLVAGFSTYLASPVVGKNLDKAMDEETETAKTDPFDSHPSLKARLEALGKLGETGDGGSRAVAISLLANAERVESQLVEFMMGQESSRKLVPISWEEVPSKVFIPQWKQSVSRQALFLEGITPAGLPDVAKRLGVALSAAVQRINTEAERAQSQGDDKPTQLGLAGASGLQDLQENISRVQALGAALLLSLCELGWTLHAEPGEAFVEKEGTRIEPFAIVDRMSKGYFDAGAWTELCLKHSLTDLNLGAVAKQADDSR